MTDLALIAQDPSALEAAGDAGAFVVLACERAKTWLTQAIEHGDIDQLIEMKSQADAIRVYTRQKELGKDAELAAAEIVRRAERGLGIAIKRGQEQGTVAKSGDVGGLRTTGSFGGAEAGHGRGQHLLKPSDVIADNNARSEFYNWAAQSEETFDDAIAEAKTEGNLSRANVMRKVKGQSSKMTKAQKVARIAELASTSMTTKAIAAEVGLTEGLVRAYAREAGVVLHTDSVVGKTRRVDANRVIAQAVLAAEPSVSLLEVVDYSTLDRESIPGWVSSLKESIRSLTTIKNRLEKELTRDTQD